jgi:hypothetical protein
MGVGGNYQPVMDSWMADVQVLAARSSEDLFLAAPDIRIGIGLNPEYCSPLQVALYKRFTALLPDVKYPSHYYAIIASSSEGDIMLARLIL